MKRSEALAGLCREHNDALSRHEFFDERELFPALEGLGEPPAHGAIDGLQAA